MNEKSINQLSVTVSDIAIGNDLPVVVIGGVNVLETADIALSVAETFCEAASRLGMPFIFKASFDKANRSSAKSYRGLAIDEGLDILALVKRELRIPVLTDVHSPQQCSQVAEVADIIQIPAFLLRQTDLLESAAETGRPLHLKKMQMMAPADMISVVAKCDYFGASEIILCERGTSFGYGRLVVDMTGLAEMRSINRPVTLDITHALQLPGALGSATGGRGEYAEPLARAGVATGIAGVFVEAHPDPSIAPCDGASATPLSEVPRLLRAIKTIDDATKSLMNSETTAH